MADTVLHTLTHHPPELENACSNVIGRTPGLLIGQHYVGDGELVFLAKGQQGFPAVEGIRQGRVVCADFQAAIGVRRHHKTTADRVIGMLTQALPVLVKCLTDHAVGVFWQGFPSVIHDIGTLAETNLMLTSEAECSCASNTLKPPRHLLRINPGRLLAFQPHHHSRSSTMPLAGST